MLRDRRGDNHDDADVVGQQHQHYKTSILANGFNESIHLAFEAEAAKAAKKKQQQPDNDDDFRVSPNV